MTLLKQTFIISLITISTLYLFADNKTTPTDREIKKELNEVHDIVLDIKEKEKKSITHINGEKVTYIKNAENVYNKTIKHKHIKKIINKKIINKKTVNNIVKKTINKHFKTVVNKTSISKNYFIDTTRCSSSCGVAIKKWKDAKKYCSIRGSRLPSKSEIENSSKYEKKECSDCSYWTNTEALRPNGRSYPNKKVWVYEQSEDDFFKYNIKSTYVATCLSD